MIHFKSQLDPEKIHNPDDYYEALLIEAWQNGECEPRGKRRDISGIVIEWLIPPAFGLHSDP
jgi:hypothetical protein